MQFNISEPGMTRTNKGSNHPQQSEKRRNAITRTYLIQTGFYFYSPQYFRELPENSSVQQMAAVASDMASAAYTPATPIKCGSINANGISRITLRSNAMKWIFWPAPTPRTYSDRHAVNRKSSYRPRIQASSSEQFLSALHRS